MYFGQEVRVEMSKNIHCDVSSIFVSFQFFVCLLVRYQLPPQLRSQACSSLLLQLCHLQRDMTAHADFSNGILTVGMKAKMMIGVTNPGADQDRHQSYPVLPVP